VLVTAGTRSVFVWDLAGGNLRETLGGHGGNIHGLAYSPDGKYLASAALDGVVILRDARTNELLGQRHLDIGKLGAMVWKPDSSGLVAGGDKLIALCEVGELLGTEHARKKDRGDPLSLAGHGTRVLGLAYSPDGRALCSWDRSEMRMWDLSGGAGQAREKPGFQSMSYGSRDARPWSPDGQRLALALATQAHIQDARTGEVLRRVRAGRCFFTYLSFTPAGRLFLAIRRDRAGEGWFRLELRDAEGNAVLFSRRLETDNHSTDVTHAAVAGPNDRHVYFAVKKNGVFRWTPLPDEVVPLFNQDTVITGLAVSPDERLAVTLGGNTAFVWNLPDGKKKLTLKHPLAASGMAILPEGRLLTACHDGLVRLWDLSGGSELFSLDLGMGKIFSFAVSPDHMTFAAGVEKKCRIVLMDVPE
jgi:WD40 repeat protein